MEDINQLDPILKPLYLSILERIVNPENTDILYFDLWNDQIDRNEDDQDDLFFNYPACFIEFQPIDLETLGRGVQQGECIFDILVASEQLNETNSLENDQERNNGLAYLDRGNTVFKLLQGFRGDCFGTITRINFQNEHSGNWLGLRVDAMRFKTRITDNNAMKKYVKMKPDLIVTVHDKKQ